MDFLMTDRPALHLLLSAATLRLVLATAQADPPATRPATAPLSTGRSLAVDASAGAEVGSLPVNLTPSADGRFVVGTDAGFDQFLWVADAATGELVGRLRLQFDAAGQG